jgi:hypothetical protein
MVRWGWGVDHCIQTVGLTSISIHFAQRVHEFSVKSVRFLVSVIMDFDIASPADSREFVRQ